MEARGIGSIVWFDTNIDINEFFVGKHVFELYCYLNKMATYNEIAKNFKVILKSHQSYNKYLKVNRVKLKERVKIMTRMRGKQ